MTIRNLIERGIDIDADINFVGTTTNAIGEPLDTNNIPQFEYYINTDNAFTVIARYTKEDE